MALDYISGHSSRTEALRTLLSLQLASPRLPPEALGDSRYANMLRTAKISYEAVNTHNGHDFLLLLRVYTLFSGSLTPIGVNGIIIPPDALSFLLGLGRNEAETLVRHLRSLTFQQGPQPFLEFWASERRAEELFVDFSRVCTHLVKCCMHHIAQCPSEINSCA